MKKQFLLVVACLFLSFYAAAQEREYIIVVHGGAGDMSALENHPEQAALYYAAIDTALQIGGKILDEGGHGIDAVIKTINYLEDNSLFNAGKGATISAEGFFELDASIMRGRDLSAGAVAGVRTVKNPINAAYAVMTKSSHVMLSGSGADRFAAEHGVETVKDNLYFATPETMKWVEQFKNEGDKNGTVGCVVLDKFGNLYAGTSTGGTFRKRWGRIGDSAVIGAGTYADNNSCAVSCTGHGEFFIRHAVAYNLCARYKHLNENIQDAADCIIYSELNADAGNGGLIAVDKKGNFAISFNSNGMFRGFLYKDKGGSGMVKQVGIHEEMIEK